MDEYYAYNMIHVLINCKKYIFSKSKNYWLRQENSDEISHIIIFIILLIEQLIATWYMEVNVTIEK